MPLSIWEYLRERARDAVLAGIQDAMDIAEQGDTNGSQHTRAIEFTSRLTPDTKQLPGASMNGHADREAVASSAPAPAAATAEKAPTRPAGASSFDDELERRLDSAGRQSSPQGRETPPQTVRRKRGRPPKSENR